MDPIGLRMEVVTAESPTRSTTISRWLAGCPDLVPHQTSLLPASIRNAWHGRCRHAIFPETSFFQRRCAGVTPGSLFLAAT